VSRNLRDSLLDILLDVQQKRIDVYTAADRIEAAAASTPSAEADRTETRWEHKTTMGTWDWCDCPGTCEAKARRSVEVKICRRCSTVVPPSGAKVSAWNAAIEAAARVARESESWNAAGERIALKIESLLKRTGGEARAETLVRPRT